MLYYLDTSVAAQALVANGPARSWFDEVTASGSDTLVSSRLLQTELTRVLRREGQPVSERAEVLDYVGGIPVSEPILATAEAITEHVKTLDSIHLASALALGSDVVVATHDANMKRVAEVLGLRTIDPVVDAGTTTP